MLWFSRWVQTAYSGGSDGAPTYNVEGCRDSLPSFNIPRGDITAITDCQNHGGVETPVAFSFVVEVIDHQLSALEFLMQFNLSTNYHFKISRLTHFRTSTFFNFTTSTLESWNLEVLKSWNRWWLTAELWWLAGWLAGFQEIQISPFHDFQISTCQNLKILVFNVHIVTSCNL